MGFVNVTVTSSNVAEPERRADNELLVETGAMLSIAPPQLLDDLGIRRDRVRRFRGFGGVVERQVGVVRFEYGDSGAGASVAFGEGDDTPVLGVTALESLGYQVDPVAGELKPTEMFQLPAFPT